MTLGTIIGELCFLMIGVHSGIEVFQVAADTGVGGIGIPIGMALHTVMGDGGMCSLEWIYCIMIEIYGGRP